MQNALIDLNQYTGTEQYYKLSAFGNFSCTDGVKYVADEAGAYWLIDAIASYQPNLKFHEFQCWKLTLEGNHNATLTCTDGDDTILATQAIDFTDFPQDITLYLTNKVLMLTSEY